LNRGVAMQDAQMLLFTGIFFVLAFLYVKACQKLR
jgi:Na+-transporting methylmalonyl-CoA/oxaloacetate decarboxylase gamma subunit